MPPQPSPCDLPALRDALASKGDMPTVLVWFKAKPRISTMRPLAATIAGAGYRVFLGWPPMLDLDPAEVAGDTGLACYVVRFADVPSLRGVDLFISSEVDISDAPADAVRFAIHHSLPDASIRREYHSLIAIKPKVAINADYYAIPVLQEPQDWQAKCYAPFVDRVFPANLLSGRPDRLTVVPFGYPKIDHLMAEDVSGVALDTITYAPTQSIKGFGSVARRGQEILSMLLAEFPDHRIAFRPYPVRDPARLQDLMHRFDDHPRYVLDESPTGEDVLRRSALVVTDRSSVAISFGLGYARPVVFFDDTRPKAGKGIGPFDTIGLRTGTIDELRTAIERLLADPAAVAERVERRRGDYICNPGRAAEYLVEAIPDILSGKSRPDWLEVPRRPFAARNRAAYLRQFERLRSEVLRRDPSVDEERFAFFREAYQSAAPVRPLRSLAGRILRRMRDPRRYLSRPRGPESR
ncbi:hypothetical protein E2L08_10275 [Palleronia sediminis]|uniref:CDP-Glycerol:Poly(Glycerophosphate) glycerophosphotransferase n=1 Tax=Palleronia sediminis TaxID=2547833 RepID=A0A4V3B9M2_9RHOB|nr:hypothetical protein [Palleronia sediminis]TDL79399.1 hypothetical protein E2L08_10275 [Palleronia sediminis]